MNQRDQDAQRVFAKKRFQYGMIGMLGGYLACSFALAVAQPMMVSDECKQQLARMQVDGTAHLNPDPNTGRLTPEQEQLKECFGTVGTVSMFAPLLFMIGGNIAGHRYADKKFGPKDPQPK